MEKSMIAFIRVFGSVASSNSELLLLLLEDPWSPLEYLLLSFLVVLFPSAYAEIFIYVLFLTDHSLEEARKMRNLHFFTGRFACLSFKKNLVFFNCICFLGLLYSGNLSFFLLVWFLTIRMKKMNWFNLIKNGFS